MSLSGASWDRTICPANWTGVVRHLEDEDVFVCGACSRSEVCAREGRCQREVEHKAMALPKRIALCPEHAPEFYYPLKDGESLTCPQCSLGMIVYERKSR